MKIKRIIALILSLTLIITIFGSVVMIRADEVTTISPEKVTDISSFTTGSDTTVTFNKGDLIKTYEFTLTKTAYVKVNIACNVGGATYYNRGSISKSGIYNKSGVLIDQDAKGETEIYDTQSVARCALLSPGTYAVKLIRDNNKYANEFEGTASINIITEELTQSSISNNKTTATKLNNNSSNTFYLTNTVRENWYRLDMPAQGEITLTYICTNKLGDSIKRRKHSIIVTDTDGENILYSANPYTYNTANTITIQASTKKTYYICINGDYYISSRNLKQGARAYEKGTFSAKWIITDDIAPTKPKLTKCSAGSNIVKGKAESYSTVYLKYKGKTYKQQASAKGKYKFTLKNKIKVNDYMKVYCVDYAGNYSKTKSYIVPSHLLSVPKQIKHKQGSKIVSGYVGRPNYTVILKIGKKTYKTKSNNDCYYKFKLTKKIYKTKNAKLKIKDDYGNSSKTKKVKFK